MLGIYLRLWYHLIMKICYKCGVNKTRDSFFKRKDRPIGIQAKCKDCTKAQTFKYSRTKRGVANKMIGTQRKGAKQRGHKAPNYTVGQLFEWLISQKKFNTIYNNWVKTGYNKWDKPSCDRIDNNKSYTFSNLKVVTWKENYDKGNRDMRAGTINNKVKPHKAVVQYDLKGNKVGEFISLIQAQRETGNNRSSIIRVCKNKQKTAGGYIWEYA